MISPVFAGDTPRTIEERVKTLLNARSDFLSEATAESTRAAGDAIEGIVEEEFQEILGDLCGEYSDSFARRAMADLAFKDSAGNYCVVDVKTHREGTMLDFYPKEARKIETRIKQFEKVKAFWLAKSGP